MEKFSNNDKRKPTTNSKFALGEIPIAIGIGDSSGRHCCVLRTFPGRINCPH